MSRRVAGRSKPGQSNRYGRSKVRLGWRKRKLRDLRIMGARMRALGVFDEAAIGLALKEREAQS